MQIRIKFTIIGGFYTENRIKTTKNYIKNTKI